MNKGFFVENSHFLHHDGSIQKVVLAPFVSRVIIFLTVFAAFIAPDTAGAADFFMTPNTEIELTSVSNSDTVRLAATPNRSYCIEILEPIVSGNAPAFTTSVTDNDVNLTVTVTDRDEAYPRLYADRGNLDASRLCVVAVGTSNDSNTRMTFDVDTFNGGVSGATVIRAFDTTLTGGFNTSVTDFNFLELTNLSSVTSQDTGQVTGKVIIKNVISDQVLSTQDFSINPNDRVDINIHDVVGTGVFGTVTVIHDAVPGRLKGVVSQYRVVSTSPFDFEPVVQQPLLTTTGLR